MFEDSSNETASEQVFDYFLQELVTGQAPPDLTQRIASAWEHEQAKPSAALVIARPVRSGHEPDNTCNADATSPRQSASLHRHLLATLLALGACGLLALLSWQLAQQEHDLTEHLLGTKSTDEIPVPLNSLPHPSSEIVLETPSQATQGGAVNEQVITSSVATVQSPAELVGDKEVGNSIDLQSSPFPLDRRLASDGSQTGWPKELPGESPTLQATQPPLDREQIVSQIDERMSRLWQSLSVTPSEPLSEAQRALRLSLLLTGQPPNNANAVNSASDLEDLIAQATESLPFARLWSDRFVNLWLASANLSADDARVQELKKHFADHIYHGRPWNAAPLELLGGTLPTGSGPDLSNQSAISTTFVSALAGDGNHRLVTTIGGSFLDVNLSCVRCHEANVSPATVDSLDFSPSSQHFVQRQAVYWSLTAMLQAIDVHASDNGSMVVVDRQAEQLTAGKPLTTFYDLLDGRLQSAEARFPDGRAWDSIAGVAAPRQALATWLSDSTVVDAATVNQVWSMVFGRPLVKSFSWQTGSTSSTPEGTGDGQEERQELQQLLAQQYRAHGHDLKQLIGWIVRSDAFGRQSVQLGRTQWLAASPEQLQKWQLAQSSFAMGALTTSTTELTTLEQTLVALLRWREAEGDGTAKNTLAQPLPNLDASTVGNPAAANDEYSRLAELRLIESSGPADVALVDRLLANRRLSWSNCVEHVSGLTAHRLANSRVHYLADELLRQHNGDARATLLDLLWAVKR